jgi:CHAD domain-containing protein
VAVHRVHWRDALAKRIAEVEVLRVGARGERTALLFVSVRPVRGEERACAQLLRGCRRDALAGATAVEPARVLREQRGGPAYRAKPVVDLDPGAPAGAGLAALFAAYGEVLWSNERGIVADIDNEFLHDFRVALRSVRSWTSDLRKVMSRASRARVKNELAALNRATGRLRDLDVLSAALPGYLAALGGIAPDTAARLASLVAQERAGTQRALAEHFRGGDYRRFRRQWPRLCEALAAGRHLGRDGEVPLLEVVVAALRRRHAQVVDFDWTRAEDDPAVLHELRKECKKLRYLLEGFQRLFDAGRCRRAIAELKLVQTAMGDTWDLHVHHALLESFTVKLPAHDAHAVLPVVVGLGARLSSLERAHVELVSRAFARFRAPGVQRIYSRLLEQP